MKKFISVSTALLLSTVTVFGSSISVILDNENIEFSNQAPTIVDGRTLIPIRGVFEKLGYEITWNADTKTAVLTKSGNEISITANAEQFISNNELKELDVPAQIINGSIMLPLRAVGEAAGLNVEWDNESKTLNLTSQINTADEQDIDYTELNRLIDNYYFTILADVIVTEYVNDFTSDEFENPLKEYGISDKLNKFIILTNEADNFNNFITDNIPENLYSSELSDAVSNYFQKSNQYCIAVTTGEDLSTKSDELLESYDKYTKANENFTSELNNKFDTFKLSENDDLKEYKENIIEILSEEITVFNKTYTDDSLYFNAIETYTSNSRKRIESLSIPDNGNLYKYIADYCLDCMDTSVDYMKETKSDDFEGSFTEQMALSSSKQILHTNLLEKFFDEEILPFNL